MVTSRHSKGPEETSAWYRSLVETSVDGMLVADADGRITFASKPMTDMCGYSATELRGRPVEVLVPNRSRGVHPRLHAEYRRDPTRRFMGEAQGLTLRHRNGSEIPVEIALTPIGKDGLTLAVVRDVSERQAIQNAQEERLRTSEEAFRTAFEQAPIGVEVITIREDGSRSIILANQALADLFGCAIPDLIGRSLSEFSDPAEFSKDGELAGMLAAGDIGVVPRTKRYRRVDGSYFWAYARAVRFSLPDVSEPVALVHVIDVTASVAEEQRSGRQARLHACLADVTTDALAGETRTRMTERILGSALDLFGGEAALLGILDDAKSEMKVEHVRGRLFEELRGAVLPCGDELSEAESAGILALPQLPESFGEYASALGPAACTRFGAPHGDTRGVLVVVRASGGDEFDADALRDLYRLAAQGHLALQLAQARADQERLARIEDRQRIAWDLHDSVVQDVIALGMQLSAEGSAATDPETAERAVDRVGQLERIVRQLRRVVFELSPQEPQSLSAALRTQLQQASRILGHQPELTLAGPTDELPLGIAGDLLSVTREALSNVARHANASWSAVALRVEDSRVTLTIEDAGDGVRPGYTPGTGLSTMLQRAEAMQGTLEVGERTPRGTRLTWSCPLV